MANDKKQTSTTVLAYDLDQQSITRTIRGGPDRVEKAITNSLDVLGDYGPITKMNLLAVEQGFKSLDRNISMHQRTIDDLGGTYAEVARQEDMLADSDWLTNLRAETEAADNAADSFERLETAKEGAAGARSGSGGSPSAGGGLETVDRIGSSASQILSGIDQGGLANVAGLVADAASATALFGPAAAVAAVAGGAFTLVMSEVGRKFEEAKEEAEDYATRLDALAQLTASGATSEDYQRQIDENERARQGFIENTSSLLAYKNQIDSLDETIANLVVDLTDPAIDFDPDNPNRRAQTQALLDQARAAQTQLMGGITEAFDGQITNYDALDQTIQRNQERIEEYTADLVTLEAEMYSAGVASNDAREALRRQQEETDQQVQQQMEIEREADAMTAEQRRARIEELIAEREALQRAASEQGISAEYSAQLAEQLEGVNARISWFSEHLDSTADKLQRVADAQEELNTIQERVTDATDEVLDANTRLTEAYQSALEATNAYNTALFEHEAALNQITTEDLAKREELETKANADRVKLQEASAKKVRDIQKKSDASLIAAIANRDVLAYNQAKDAAVEQASAEEESYKEREKELSDSLRQQLADQDKALRQAVDRENQRWEQERQTRVRANQQALIDTQNAENAQRMVQQQSNVAALNLMQYRATGEAQLYEGMARNAEFWLTYMANRTSAAWQAMATATASPLSGGGGGVGRAMPTAFADGGIVTSPGLAMLHSPEVIIPLKPAGRMPLPSSVTNNQNMGGPTFNIQGMTPQQIITQVTDTLHDYFSRAGLIQG